MAEKQLSEVGQRHYWYIAEGILLLLAIAYLIVFLSGNTAIAMYLLLALGIVTVGAAIVMWVQRHFITMLVNCVIVLIIILHFVQQVYF